MDEVIGKLEVLTSNFVQTLDTTDTDAMVRFVEERQELINEFTKIREQMLLYEAGDDETQSAVNRKMADRIQHVLSYDPLINDKLAQLMGQTAQQVNKINQSRKREQAYNRAYSADSIYFDKKK